MDIDEELPNLMTVILEKKIILILTFIKSTSASQEFETFSKYATANIFLKKRHFKFKT